MIYYEGDKVIEQGLIPFITLTIAPSSELNPIPFFFSAGLVYQGPFSGRDEDTTSFGLAYGNFSRDLAGRDFEMVMELTHSFVITPWLNVHPISNILSILVEMMTYQMPLSWDLNSSSTCKSKMQ